jgi:hypothetical protein
MAIRVTQTGVGVWVLNTSKLRVTQLAVGVWRTVANAPAPAIGNADGVASVLGTGPPYVTGHANGEANVQGYSKTAVGTGQADGQATVIGWSITRPTPHYKGAALLGAGL